VATQGEIARALASIQTTLTDQKAEGFDPEGVQQIVDDALGAAVGEHGVRVTAAGLEGGYLFDGSKRVGEIRRAGEDWRAEETG
jgi:hypothetical protein